MADRWSEVERLYSDVEHRLKDLRSNNREQNDFIRGKVDAYGDILGRLDVIFGKAEKDPADVPEGTGQQDPAPTEETPKAEARA